MDALNDFLDWARARHQNLSWYVRPLFILPFCYLAYKKNVRGIVLTLVGVASSMFWFPVPTTPDPRAVALLDVEHQYVGDPDGYLIEVGQYTQMALESFKNDAS